MSVYYVFTYHVLERASIYCRSCGTGVLILLSLSITGRAAEFVIDENLSTIRIAEGTMIGNTFTVVPQDSDASGDSLETNLSGTLSASVSGSTLTFSGTSVIDAVVHRLAPFLPTVATSGSGAVEDDDNFGGVADLFGEPRGPLALRDMIATITTGSVTIGSPGTNLLFSVTQGTLDFNITLLPPGFADLATALSPTLNTSTDPVTGSIDGTINIPFYVDIDDIDIPQIVTLSRLVLEGLIVATRTGGVPGDFNGDGKVDGDDFLFWQLNPSVGSLADWEANYGMAASLSASSAAVPEPASCGLALAALCLVMSRRRYF